MTYPEYIQHAALTRKNKENTYLRLGQHFVNILGEIRPDIHVIISGSPVDPFHDDTRIADFLDLIEDMWGKDWSTLKVEKT